MENKKRRFADVDKRKEKVSKYLCWGATVVNVVTVILMQINKNMIKNKFAIIFMVLLAIVSIAIMRFFAYKKNDNTDLSQKVILSIIGVFYIISNIVIDNSSIKVITYSLVFTSLLYFDKKLTSRISGIILLIYVARTMITIIFNGVVGKELYNAICEIIVAAILSFAAYILARVLDMFTKDIFGTIEDEKEEVDAVLKEVLNISNVVQNQSLKVNDIIDNLEDSSQNVLKFIEEITKGTQNTCESIEDQSIMTQSIQTSINNTSNKAQNIVEVSNGVQKSINDSNKLMELLNDSSNIIININKGVMDTMVELQNKTKDLRSFSETIYSISNQTNMLALNASIESARAGEAGKGFAVVAEQIRVLAEQSRQATENINNLLEELKTNTDNAFSVVDNSIKETNKQIETIYTVSNNFNNVDDQMKELIDDIAEINKMVKELLNANDSIVSSIAQLSQVSEQVTANSSEVSNIAMNNQENTKKAKELLEGVLEVSHKLDKYIN